MTSSPHPVEYLFIGRCTVATSLYAIFVSRFSVCFPVFVNFVEYMWLSICIWKLCSLCGYISRYYFCHCCPDQVMFLRHLNCLPRFNIPANYYTTSRRRRHPGQYRPAYPNGHRPGTAMRGPLRNDGGNAAGSGIGFRNEETDPHFQLSLSATLGP